APGGGQEVAVGGGAMRRQMGRIGSALLAAWFITATIVSAYAQEARKWSAKSIVTIKGHTAKVSYVAIRPDGRVLASAAPGKQAPELMLWDAATGKEISAPDWPQGYVASFAFSGDSKRLLETGGSGKNGRVPTILIWDIGQRKVLATHEDNRF